ncbi:prepilin-type N-terminal cleavage/methylation domain-containing protein, partial [Thermosynechococcus sp.]
MTILRVSRLQALHSSQKGLTLLECVVAILVVNLAIAMLTMPLAIVAAT